MIARLRQSGFLLLLGFILILYISLGFAYWQQKNQQANLEKQIAQQSLVLSKPLASGEKLRADYANVTGNNSPLVSIPDDYAAFALLVGIAERSGISTDTGKLNIPSPVRGEAKIGESTFQLISFHGISIQGDNSSVKAFLADLDNGKTLETMVLKRVVISYTVIPFTATEIEQRDEFKMVALATKNMMADNNLSRIPKPLSFALGRATNFMGDDPTTNTTFEGFPDNTTTIREKGYTGNGSARGGYVLYKHDKILTNNTSRFETVNYLPILNTKYYYTVEADGTIRQFSGPDVNTAVEYQSTKGPRVETIASIDVDIYIRTPEKK